VRNKNLKAYATGTYPSITEQSLAKHFGKSPAQLSSEDVRTFQVHLLHARTSWSQFNQIVCGLRFFFRVTLGRPEVVQMLWRSFVAGRKGIHWSRVWALYVLLSWCRTHGMSLPS